MKKVLLLSLAVCMGVMVFAQKKYQPVSKDAPKTFLADPVAEKPAPITSMKERFSQTYYVNGRELTFVPIGSAGNAYGIYGNPRTYVWADDRINSVVFSHRMIVDPPSSYGNSRLAYDVSWDGGMDGTWTNDIHVYDPTGPGNPYPQNAGRYPQGGIINPVDNTDPLNAHYTYFAATLSGTNGDWGGYGYGANSLAQVDPPAPTQHNDTDVPPYKLIPEAFTITQDGVAWMAEYSYDMSSSSYTGEYIFYRGEINEAGDDIEYETWTMDGLEEGEGINDTKIAFDPSGEIGYLMIMSESLEDPMPFTGYHPILYETTDGGETWSEDPNHCQLGGADGIEAIKNFLPDTLIELYYDAGFDRNEVWYNLGYHADMVVDYKGNPHITGYVTLAEEDGWYPYADHSGTFHIWYDRETQTWDAHLLYMNRTFDGTFNPGELPMYNRPYISSDMNGRFMFMSWLDTDQPDIEDNVLPDIYLVSYDMQAPEGERYGDVENVTAFTQAMWKATWGSQSHYVFEELINNDTEIEFTIPLVYQLLTDGDPTQQVESWYIDGYTFTFPNYWVGVEENKISPISKVKQNYPNPFSNTTKIEVDLKNSVDLSLEVINLVGQKVMEFNRGTVEAGSHEFEINAEQLQKGIYFYTVNAGSHSETKKMIVE